MTGSTFTEKFIERQLKMYHLNPNDYGEEWYTITYDKTEALNNILNFIKTKIDSEISFKSYYTNYYELFNRVDINNLETFPDKYTLDEYENGSVIRSEIA